MNIMNEEFQIKSDFQHFCLSREFFGMSLQDASYKSLRIIKGTYPKTMRISIGEPAIHEIDSFFEICQPTGQGLQTGVGEGLPTTGDLVVYQRRINGVSFLGHHQQSLQTIDEIRARLIDFYQKIIQLLYFLDQNCCQRWD